METQKLMPLGNTGLSVPRLGIGAWAWGDRLVWGFGRGYTDADIRGAFQTSVQAGVNFFDTAEVYGSGRSERFLGAFAKDSPSPVFIATKFFPFPWRLSKKELLRALQGSIKRLGLEQVDLYQIHNPVSPVSIETWAEALGEAVHQGLARAVGVSNFNRDQMRRAYDVLAKKGVSLASNQVEYSLVDRKVERDGLLELCHELGITLIAYSPIAKGLLTGKYSTENPLPGVRGLRYPKSILIKVQPLLHLMQEIGQEHDGKSISQVALNWVVCKEALPIPGAKTAAQATENIGAIGWRLTDAEVTALDEASQRLG